MKIFEQFGPQPEKLTAIIQNSRVEAKVREVAEAMAMESHPGTWPAGRESLIERYTQAARMALRLMELEAREAHNAGWRDAIDGQNTKQDKLNLHLSKRGLL